MKTMPLDRKIEDTNSKEFKQISNEIENGLMNLLSTEENVEELNVLVEKVIVDRGEVDFKIHFNIHESFLAVPFELKPVIMTNILHKEEIESEFFLLLIIIQKTSFQSANTKKVLVRFSLALYLYLLAFSLFIITPLSNFFSFARISS